MSFDTGYSVNNSNYTNKDLADIFPTFEIKTVTIDNDTYEVSGDISLSKNYTETSNYNVFATYYYSAPDGSGSVYNKFEASTSANSIITYDFTSTQFSYALRKATGDEWRGGIQFLIIYN